jgi:hypothetical protein
MVDNLNPTNQFHPYQPETSTPAAERNASGFGGVLNSIKGADLNESIGKARTWANANPSKVLGGLAALAIGAGLMRRRS